MSYSTTAASHDARPNHFDADAYLGTLETPRLTVGGHTFQGRFLGVEDWLRFAPRLDRLADGQLPATEMRAIIRDLTRAIFPGPVWWQPWTWRKASAARALARMPLAVQLQALTAFTHSQATALNPVKSGAPPALGVTVTAGGTVSSA